MPLHLLGKKSWNVYNADNVERVRRDEAAAKAAEEAAEERMQEFDAKRRLAIMRGETPPPLPEEESVDVAAVVKRDDRRTGTGERKKRKRAGEDDTDFEMRVAMERRAEGEEVRRRLMAEQAGADGEVAGWTRGAKDVPAGPATFGALKEVERGWYVKPVLPSQDVEAEGKDAFGRNDPGRRARDAVRLDKNDPLAMMRKGAAKVREIKKERQQEEEARERELRALKKEQRRAEKRRKRDGGETNKDDELGELEGFNLDAPVEKEKDDDGRRRSRHQSRHEDRRHNDHERRQRSRHRTHHDERLDDKDERSRKSRHRSREEDERRHRKETEDTRHGRDPDRQQSKPYRSKHEHDMPPPPVKSHVRTSALSFWEEPKSSQGQL